MSDDPTFLTPFERNLEGLRKAGCRRNKASSGAPCAGDDPRGEASFDRPTIEVADILPRLGEAFSLETTQDVWRARSGAS